MKTKILKVKGDWIEVVNDCRATVGKEPLGKEPSREFKRKMVICEHSPIRDISIKWIWDGIKSWVATHWVRHKWECFVKTQRTDRTGVNRDKMPQDTLVTFTGEANTQGLIDTQRKRMCFQAAPDTREYAEDLKVATHEVEAEISDGMVPNCIYRCGCPEMEPCGFFKKFVEYAGDIDLLDIQARYDKYNEMFYARRKKEEA